MRRVVILLPVLLAALAVTLLAAPEADEALTVEMDHTVINLYDTVGGTVDGLRAREKFTVELVDAYGRVLERQQLRRKEAKDTPFRVQIRHFSTPVMRVEVTAASGGKGTATVQCVPPTGGWESFLIATASVSGARDIESSKVLRLIGIRAGASADDSSLVRFNQGDLRVLALDTAAGQGFDLGAGAVRAAFATFEARTDKNDLSAFARPTCLSDPEMPEKAFDVFLKKTQALSRYNPVGYALFSAGGVTPENRAVDFCFDQRTLEEFRTWLKKKAPSPAALGRRWRMKFRRWDDVVPMTTQEILAREYARFKRTETLNFAPWVAHRAFMDEKYASVVNALCEKINLDQKGMRVGFRGGRAPAAFGGYDWTLLADKANFIECTDETFKRLVASLNRQRVHPGYLLGSVSDKVDPAEFIRQLWTNVAAGDLGVIIEPGNALFDRAGLPTDLAYKARRSLVALDGLGHVIVDKEFAPASKGVAVYYSQPSVRVQYLLDAGARGEAFTPGERSDDLFTSTWHRNMLAWTELLDDVGVEFEYLSYRKLSERGWSRDVKVVILPKVVSLSKEEAAELRRFVERGGTLIADSQTGTFDEDGVEQERGALDAVFGIRRDGITSAERGGVYTQVTDRPLRLHRETGRFKGLADGVALEHLKPVEPKLEPTSAGYHLKAARTHAVLTRPVKRGGAVYLNLSLINYPWDRAETEKVSAMRTLLRRTLAAADVTPHAALVKVDKTPPPDLALRQYRHHENDFLFVVRRGAPPAAPARPVVPLPMEPEPEVPPGVPPEGQPPQEEMPPPTPPVEGPPVVQFNQMLEGPPASVAAPDYRLKAGDTLRVEVARQPDLSRVVQVREDGKVALGLVGDIEVAGRTTAEIDAELTMKYRQYIVGAEVTVGVVAVAAVQPEKPDEEKPEPEKPVIKVDFFKVKLDRERYVYDVLAGRFIGKTDEPLLMLPEGRCAVLALLDYEVKAVDVNVSLRPQMLNYRIRVTSDGQPGLHALRVEFVNPDGDPVAHYTTTLRAVQGQATGVFNLALNDAPGEWTVRVTDVLSGAQGEAKFTLK